MSENKKKTAVTTNILTWGPSFFDFETEKYREFARKLQGLNAYQYIGQTDWENASIDVIVYNTYFGSIIKSFLTLLPLKIVNQLVDVPYSAVNAFISGNARSLEHNDYFDVNLLEGLPITEVSLAPQSGEAAVFDVTKDCFHEKLENLSAYYVHQYICFLSGNPRLTLSTLLNRERWFRTQHGVYIVAHDAATLCFDFAFSCNDNDLFCSEVGEQYFESLIANTCYLNSQGRSAVSRTVQFMAMLLRQFGVLEDELRLTDSLNKLGFYNIKAFTDTPDKDMHIWNGYPHSFREQDLLFSRMRKSFYVNQQEPMSYVPFELLDFALDNYSHLAIGAAINRIALCFVGYFKGFELPSESCAVDRAYFANYIIPASLMYSIYQDKNRVGAIEHVKEQLQTCFLFENYAEDDIYASTPMMQLLYKLQTAAKQRFEMDCNSYLDIHYFALKIHFSQAKFTELPEGLLLEFPGKYIFSLLANGDAPEEYRCLKIESQRFQLYELESAIASFKTLQESKLTKSLSYLSKLKVLGQQGELKTLYLDNYVQETHALLQIAKEYDLSQYNRAFEAQMPFKGQVYGLLHRIIAYCIINATIALLERKEAHQLDFLHIIDYNVLKMYENVDYVQQIFQIRENSGAGGLGKFMDLALWFCHLEMAQFFCYLDHGLTNRRLSLNNVACRLFYLYIADRRARFVADFFKTLYQNDAKQYPVAGTTGCFPEVSSRFDELHPDKVAFILCYTCPFTKKELATIYGIYVDYSANSILATLRNPDVYRLYSVLGARPLLSYYSERYSNDFEENKSVTYQALKEIDYFNQDMQLASIANRRETGSLQLYQAAVKYVNAALNDIRNGFLELAFKSFVFQTFCQCDHNGVNSKDQRERLASQYLQILYILLYTDFRGGRFSKLLQKMVAYARISVEPREQTEGLPESCSQLLQAGINFFFIQSVEKTIQLIFYSKIYEQHRLYQKRLGPEIEKALRYRLLVLYNKVLRQENLVRTAHLAFSEYLVQFLKQYQLSVTFSFYIENQLFLKLISNKELVEFDATEVISASTAVQQPTNAEENVFPQFRYIVLEESESSHYSAEPVSEHYQQQKMASENDSPPGLNLQQGSNDAVVCKDAAPECATIINEQQIVAASKMLSEPYSDERVNEPFEDSNFVQLKAAYMQNTYNAISIDDLPPGLIYHADAPYRSIFNKDFQFSSDICVLDNYASFMPYFGIEKSSTYFQLASGTVTADMRNIEHEVHSFLYSAKENYKYLPLTSYHFMLAAYRRTSGAIFLPFQPANPSFYYRLFTCFPELQLLITDFYLPQLSIFDSYRVHVAEEYFQAKRNLVETVLSVNQSIPPDLLLLCKASFLSEEHILALAGLSEYNIIAIKVFAPSYTTVAKTIFGEYGSTVTLKCGHCIQFAKLQLPLILDYKMLAKCPKCLQSCDLTVSVQLTPMQTDLREMFGTIGSGVFLYCAGVDAWLTDGRDCEFFDYFYYNVK